MILFYIDFYIYFCIYILQPIFGYVFISKSNAVQKQIRHIYAELEWREDQYIIPYLLIF